MSWNLLRRTMAACPGSFYGLGRWPRLPACLWLVVYAGVGAERVGPAVNYPVGGMPISISAGDFNGDGRPDLASANLFSGTVRLLTNTTGRTITSAFASENPHSALPISHSANPGLEPRPSGGRPALGEYRVDNWTTDRGLPQNTVQCLLQSHDGYLWIGTQSGLARYDGQRFTIFDRNNTPAFRRDNILCLAEGPDHALWIGTTDGFLRLRDHTFTYFNTVALGLPHTYVWSICPSQNGRVWIGAGGVLARFQNEQWIAATNLPIGRLHSLFEDNLGQLWIGADDGLFRRTPDSGRPAMIEGIAWRNQTSGASGLYQDRQGNIWFGADGLVRWRDGRLQAYRTEQGLSPGLVTSIAEDAGGALWLAVGHHLNRFQAGEFTDFDSQAGLPKDEMHCVCPDREGNVWLGTARSGLVRLRPRPLVTYTTQDGLVDDDVWSVCEGPAGEMWFGTTHGVSRLADEKFTNYPDASSPVFQDRSGTVWLQMKGGLAWLRNGEPELYAPEERIFLEKVASLYEGHSGAVWVTADGGLWRFQGGRRELYTTPRWTNAFTFGARDPRLRGCSIHTNAPNWDHSDRPVGTLEDYQGNLWVGSKASGLHRLRDGQFTTLTTSNGLTSDYVAPLLADPDGTLWIGSDKGLNRLKDGRVTRYTAAEGLAENIVGNLLEDDDGWFWTLGHHGIHRMRKQDLIELAEGKRREFRTLSYGEADGMLSSEGNVGVFPNTCQTPDGLLWFPTTRGVVVVEHNQMQTREQPPPVVLEQVLADDEIVFGDGVAADVRRRMESQQELRAAAPSFALSRTRLRLPPGRAQLLEFRYTANTFVAPEQVRFKYQLVGHDRDWRDAGLRRTATYTDVAPGAYRFRVSAINSHGVESDAPAEFAFSLAPFFYQTREFYAASALAVVLIGLGLHRLRVGMLGRRQALEQQLALALQRERIAKDMHDDLGASLTQIGLLSEHARRDPNKSPTVAADVAKIADAARQSAQAAEEIVWTVNPRHDTLDSLATYLCQFAREYLEPSAVRCRLDVPEFLPDLRVPSEVRHNLVLFVKEALNNAVKHAAAQQVTVALRFENHTLTLTVTDDGRGFDRQNAERGRRNEERPSAGNGLGNMRQRVEAVGGEFELQSEPGKGTRVQAVVRLNHR